MDTLLHKASGLINQEHDLIAELLAGRRSQNTRHAYERDLLDFFMVVAGEQPHPEIVKKFLDLSRYHAIALVLQYKSSLIDRGLKESTVNRRLAAIKALVNYARSLGLIDWSLADIKSEKVTPYRDTTGVSPDAFSLMLQVPDQETLKGLRDYAILRLLWDNVLRRAEISQTSVGDFDAAGRSLRIYGKGKGTQAQKITLSAKATEAIQQWLLMRGKTKAKEPLFIALDRANYGHRLTGTGIYKIVRLCAEKAGIEKLLSPHRIRHSGITAALEATGGDVRKVQKLSRHANINTLMIYDDNRANLQKEVTDILSLIV